MSLAQQRSVIADGASEAMQKVIDQISDDLTDDVILGQVRIARVQYREFVTSFLRSLADEQGDVFLSQHAKCVEISVPARRYPVLLSGYFTPIMRAARSVRAGFSAPVYAQPPALVTADPAAFGIVSKQQQIVGRVADRKFVPFYSRKEITDRKAPIAPILAWMDPIDAFHAQTQGSVVLEFDDGQRMSLEFAAKNGHRYVALGRELPIAAPVSWQKIETYLRLLPAEELRSVLNVNPSYVFFTRSDTVARTASSHPAIARRTVAVDRAVYPFGTLGILIREGQDEAGDLVVAHDVGGAIRGPLRLDWYAGLGPSAALEAGELRAWARFSVIVPK